MPTCAGAAAGKGMNMGNIKALIQALPQFRDVLGKLSVHIFISRWDGALLTPHTQRSLWRCSSSYAVISLPLVYVAGLRCSIYVFSTPPGPACMHLM